MTPHHSEEQDFQETLVSRAMREMREEEAETDRETYTEGETFPFSAFYFSGFRSRSNRLPSQRHPRRHEEE